MFNIIALCALLLLTACESVKPPLVANKITFADLPGFQKDNLSASAVALKRSCQVIRKTPTKTYPVPEGVQHLSGTYRDWLPFCVAFEKAFSDAYESKASKKPAIAKRTLVYSDVAHERKTHDHIWRVVMEQYLTPYALSIEGNNAAHFTGYYEPLLHGSLRKHGRYKTPLYRIPSDNEIKAKNINLRQPRRAIVDGALAGKGLELVYVDSAIDAFFLQIQGSGRVKLDNGKVLRLGFAGQNKHDYHPIGKTLVQQGHLTLKEVTMQGIRKWLAENPDKAEDVMSTNQSYVYFRILPDTYEWYENPKHGHFTNGPIGSQGVRLTEGRSMAVDPSYIAMGAPLWVHNDDFSIDRLVIAQDTGGAIKGGLRADYYWGFGPEAARKAGVMNSSGKMYLLLPKT